MILFFDTETTGKLHFDKHLLHEDQPDLVQLAGLLDDDTGRTVQGFNFIIHPYGFSIPVEAANIHGITDTIAQECGIELAKALSDFKSFAEQADTIVCHNIDFDLIIVQRAFYRAFNQPFYNSRWSRFCTMKAATEVCKVPSPRGRGYKWPTMQEAYQLLVDPAGFEGAHDALEDVKACRAVYYALMNKNVTWKGDLPKLMTNPVAG